MPILALIATVAAGIADPAVPFRTAAELAAAVHGDAAELVQRARRALDARAYDEAAAWAALAEWRAPDDAAAPLVLGLARFRGGRAADAVAPFSRASARAPASATARFNLASALFEAGRAADAEPTYLQAATLDPKLEPLALLDAGIAAAGAGADARAVAEFAAAEKKARALGQDPVAERAARFAADVASARAAAGLPELHRLARAGKEALLARRYDDAVARYREALALAERSGTSAADRAEVHYGLGHAYYRKGDLVRSARAFEDALALAPKDPEFHFMLGLVHFDAGADFDARAALERALALGLPADEARRAHEILATLRQAHRSESARFYIEARVGGGYDSDVPQSGIVVTAVQPQNEPTAAPFLSADLDLFWRPAGTPRNGVTVDYRFGQLAYISTPLDPYSLQEHDLTLSGAWSPHDRVTLESGVDGYVLFEGIQTFAPFQWGFSLGPRVTVREDHGFETRLRYQHAFKFSLDPYYEYLSGNRDEAGAQQVWRDENTRVSLGYLFAREAIGVQEVALKDLVLPIAAIGSFNPNSVYFIPYSYYGHELSLAGTRDLPWDVRASLTLRYEHRDYPLQSYIEPPSGASQSYFRARVDDRFSVDVALRYLMGNHFSFELAYTFIVNVSTIDNTRAATPLDYDDKNYLRHVIGLEFSYLY